MNMDEHELPDFMNVGEGATGDVRAMQGTLDGTPLETNNVVHD